MREKVGAAEQEPVKKENIVDFHAIKHDQKPREELKETEIVPYAIPCGEKDGSCEQQNSDALDEPANDMRAGKALFFIGNRR